MAAGGDVRMGRLRVGALSRLCATACKRFLYDFIDDFWMIFMERWVE